MPRVLLLIVAMACAPAPRGSDVRVPDVVPELCNGVDDDGDGLVDEADPDLVGAFEVAWPVDADGDGFPGGQRVERTCDPTPPPPAPPSDCNDADPHTFPGAARHESATSCMRDADGDGWGDPQRPLGGRGGRDCDDGDPFAYPGAAAREAQGSCTRDADRDGYGALIPPPGGRAGTDCDDTDPLIRPGALDLPYDGVDADCAGDDDLDRDGDGHRALVVPGGDDCDDRNPSVHPGAVDVALDGVDQDCDGHDNCDGDGDGFEALACGGTDCADGDPFRHPLAVERCDGVDQDCDGVADDGLPARVVWRDRDRDGFGDPTTSDSRCLDEAGSWVAQAGDCDDSDRLRRPGAPERCNDLDDDCDGLVDVGAVEGRDWFPDDDGDGYGRTADRVHVCIGPPGHVLVGGDCEDAWPGIHPDQVDRSCGDLNCNGPALRVPDDVPDIATALSRRSPGDTVCLGEGTFPVEVSTDAAADPIRLRGVNPITQDRTILVPVASGRTLLETRSGLDLQALTVVADDAPALVVHNGDVLLSEVRLTGTGGLTPTSRPTCTGLLLDQRALPRSTRLERVHVVDVNCGAAGVTAGDPGLVRTAGPLELIDVYVGDVDLDQRRGLTGGLFRGGRLSRVDGLVVEGVWIASEGLVQGAVLSAASLSSVHDVRVDGLGVEAPALRGGLVHTTLGAGATTTLTRVALRDVALVSQGVGDELTGIVAYAAGSAPVPAGELEVRQLLVAGLVVSTGYTHGGGRLLHAMAGHGTLAYATIVGIEDWSAGSFSARIGHAAHGWDARGVVVAWDDSTRHDDAWFVSATGGWNAVWKAEWTDVPAAPWVGVPGFVTPAPDSVLPAPREVAGWDLHLVPGSPLLQRGPPDEEDGATGKRASIGAYGGPDGSW